MRLSVENKILNYKGISYQISQITSMKIVEIKIKNKNVISLSPLRSSLPVAIIGILLGFFIIKEDAIGVGLVILLLTLLFYQNTF